MPLPHLPADVKFDAVSGDYYPIIYFNDYWNLQKDYYPINESLASLPLRVSFCPLSLWRWQLYAAQSTKSPWNFLGDELYEQSDEEQDSVKVRWGRGLPSTLLGCRRGRGSGPGWRPGDLRPVLPDQFHNLPGALPPAALAGSGIPSLRLLWSSCLSFSLSLARPSESLPDRPFLILFHSPFPHNFGL